MPISWDAKDPDEVLDYVIDWSARLGAGDTVATSLWVVPAGITRDSDSHTSTTTTIWLSGGTLGEKYTFVNRVTTAGGRTMDQSVTLRIKTK